MQSDLACEEKFNKEVEVLGLVVPSSEVKSVIAAHKSLMANFKNLKLVQTHEDPLKKVILFDPSSSLPEELAKYEKISKKVKLNYTNYSYYQVLKELLPSHITIPTGFETIGHIAHFNLSDEQYPYRNLIGTVIVQKIPNIRTVVTKIGKIETVFRTFTMEVIGGEDNLITVVKEGNCEFTFDFSSVYWNSKLSAERDRVLMQLKAGDVVCDLFAGVGPFAIRAAKKGCKVIANDLNPSCFEYLVKNMEKNKVEKLVKAYNQDAREIFKILVSGDIERESGFVPFGHVYMNLPMDAIEFLDVFKGAFDSNRWERLPTVHVYGFAMEQRELEERMLQVWGNFDLSILRFHKFRDVSPKKFMFCVEFVVPENIAFENSGEELRKIPKIIDDEEAKLKNDD